MADKLYLSLTFLFAGFLGVTLSQANQDGWGTWIDISFCTARPCNCSEKERVTSAKECKKGDILQIRGCAGDTCDYQDNTGSIRKAECNNLNKFCPGWSEWKKDKCECEGNSTTGTQLIQRNCTNPSPILGLEGPKCRINDDKEGLSVEELIECTCSQDDNDEDDSTETTTQPTTTPEIKYCKCPSANDSESYFYDGDDSMEGPDFSKPDHTSKPTTTTVVPDPVQYNQYGLDYGDYDDEKLCLCNETMSNDNETMSYGSNVSSEASDEETVTLTYD